MWDTQGENLGDRGDYRPPALLGESSPELNGLGTAGCFRRVLARGASVPV